MESILYKLADVAIFFVVLAIYGIYRDIQIKRQKDREMVDELKRVMKWH